ncbi:putative nuclear actin-related protein [Naematelia encephala]|uniref:Putative nuclear actin-related protein n=1 Tax=Naematelia encephala TaxID=71784 RepID=A0A1Y2BG11_9TREE|nr:putative nuclear actin-related protein [Naematelia encephala]
MMETAVQTPSFPATGGVASEAVSPSVYEASEIVAGPSTTPIPAPGPVRRPPTRKPKKIDGLLAYTAAHVPGLYNVRNPAGDFLQKESNVEVARQISVAKRDMERRGAAEERQRSIEDGQTPEHPLARTLIIHPGSRNLRLGRANDFYPKEIPNCIARRGDLPSRNGGLKRAANGRSTSDRGGKRTKGEAGVGEDVTMDQEADDTPAEDPVDARIGYLRSYLREKLSANRLKTDWKDRDRVIAANSKVRPEPIPEHNDPYRFDWTEVNGKDYFIGTEALRLPESSGFKVRYPILYRSLNRLDWPSLQSLLDDIETILRDALLTELNITPKEYKTYSVVVIVPDHGDRAYVQEMSNLLLSVMGFREIAVHQEAYTAIFAAGMSSACVVDIGAQQASITCVDEGVVNAESRMKVNYGGDDITRALVTILLKSAFPYKNLDLSRIQDWLMMDNLKIKICTLEEHLVANTPWDFHVLRPEGLTMKYALRTYDENILAPLCLFDTRMIDFESKKGEESFKLNSDGLDDLITSTYGEPTGAMRSYCAYLFPAPPAPPRAVTVDASAAPTPADGTASSNGDAPKVLEEAPEIAPSSSQPGPTEKVELKLPMDATPVPSPLETTPVPPVNSGEPTPPLPPLPVVSRSELIEEASHAPLDAAIVASLALAGTENKVKVACSSILLIGGGSALKGLGPFIAERLPALLRAKGLADSVNLVPPPRNLNPRFVCWKGASVMCNLESLADMWIGKDEWEAVGAKALKERYFFF